MLSWSRPGRRGSRAIHQVKLKGAKQAAPQPQALNRKPLRYHCEMAEVPKSTQDRNARTPFRHLVSQTAQGLVAGTRKSQRVTIMHVQRSQDKKHVSRLRSFSTKLPLIMRSISVYSTSSNNVRTILKNCLVYQLNLTRIRHHSQSCRICYRNPELPNFTLVNHFGILGFLILRRAHK